MALVSHNFCINRIRKATDIQVPNKYYVQVIREKGRKNLSNTENMANIILALYTFNNLLYI